MQAHKCWYKSKDNPIEQDQEQEQDHNLIDQALTRWFPLLHHLSLISGAFLTIIQCLKIILATAAVLAMTTEKHLVQYVKCVC